MPIKVNVTSVIEKFVGGQRSFESEGKTIDELIQAINNEFPGFANQLLEEDGELRRFVNIYINDEDVRYLGGLATELKDNDEVSILPALAGG
jgi:molybdopterin synthase sulfur carrier subunit|tara:strand:- start:450 stop:725 length:276 start_codon:yes stop_codon:yes gene_type:complete